MKILYVDSFKAHHAQSNITGLLSAFQLFGDVDKFDYRTLAKISSSGQMNKALVKTCLKNNYNFIFLGKCESVAGESIKIIKEQTSSFVVSFLGDFYYDACPFKVEQNEYADLSLFSYFEKDIIDKYNSKNSGFWTDGSNPGVDNDMGLERIHDVTFLGHNHSAINNYLDNYSFRYELMKKIDNEFDLHVYGDGWDGFKNKHGWVQHGEKTKAVNLAKITLGVSAVKSYLYLSWPRVFQTMCCGTMHMTQYVPGLELLFKNHSNIVWFNTIEEAKALLKYYLKRDALRNQIARSGREMALQHSYANRVKGIIECKIKDDLFGYLGL
jgi:hypothetical protein